MSERLRNTITVAALVVMAIVLVALVVTSPTDADRVDAIGHRIRCPVCQGESIADSPAQMARDMMTLVEERVSDGARDQAIIDELLFSYSGAVLLDPPARGSTLVLWLAPVAALAVGAGVIVWWRRHPTTEPAEAPEERSRTRRLAPLLVLAGAFAVIVVVAGFFLQEREGPNSGVANLAGQDLGNVSNETMEAVIDANADHPQVDGMRLALAERYYEVGNFRSAFPHYLAVAESQNSTEPQAVTALIRLGWMAWEGNGQVEAAVDLLDQALAIDGNSDTARYLKAQVLWCGANQPEKAATLIEDVLADPQLAEESRDVLEADLEAIESGTSCT